MSLEISYSILRYKHSEFLGEVLNVGVIFIIPALDIIEFHYPKKINRLNAAYPSLNENVIKNYLKSFEKKTKNLSKYISKYSFDFNELLFDQLIVEDASSLQFDKFRNAIFFGDYKASIDNYVNLLLGPYNSPTQVSEKKISDTDVVLEVKRELERNNKGITKYIGVDEQRILKYKNVSFKSDFYWKNTSTHFVKGLSFDLASESNIVEKSILINGQLRQLEKSKLRNTKIDLIVHQPSNLVFLDAFKDAQEILQDNDLEKSIIPSSEAIQYSETIIKAINKNL